MTTTAIGPARLRRTLTRLSELRAHDPLAALSQLHQLQDAGGDGPEAALLEAELLLDLGCGTFAASVAERSIARDGGTLPIELLRLRGTMAAFAHKRALPLARALARRDDLTRSARHEIARALHELGDFDTARALYAGLLAENSDDIAAHVNLGHIHQKLGEMDAAEACFEAALAINPLSGHGIRLLAYVRRQTNPEPVRARVAAALPHLAPASEDTAAAHYALGKALEDGKDHQGAFASFAKGAAIMRDLAPYSHDATQAAFDATRAYFDDRPRPALPQPTDRPEPLFIVGLPRTGSTLLDRMLGCHSQVIGMGELGNFKEAMKVVTGYAGGPGFHEHFYGHPDRPVDVAQIGALYYDTAAPEGFEGRWFTDKYHMNFLDLGLIAEALPNARFLHTVRDPLDTVFGNFKQMFSLGFHHFSYDLEECARYYVCYRALMDFWTARLPDRILTVDYAQLVRDPAGTLRGVKDFLGLDWEDTCLSPERNRAPVDTASLAQVRQPIYTSAIGTAARYGAALGPARAVLEAAGLLPEQAA